MGSGRRRIERCLLIADKSAFHETYVRAAGAVAFVAIIDAKGDEGIGSAFHIGNGIFVTARHVIDGVAIKETATTKSPHLTEEAGGKAAPPRRLEIVDGPYFGPEGLDVAVFRYRSPPGSPNHEGCLFRRHAEQCAYA
jgi:hypothetical protein